MTSLSSLRLLAGKVFPGPWTNMDDGRGVWHPNAKIGGLNKFLDIRGWGYLTGHGHGALALSEDAAIEIQKATGDYIAMLSPAFVLKMVAVCEAAEGLLPLLARYEGQGEGGTTAFDAPVGALTYALQQLSSASEGAA